MDRITVASTNGKDSVATFKGNVSTLYGLTLGNGTGTENIVIFDATGGAITVAGTVDGTAGDTNMVIITGGATTTVNDWNIGTVYVSETGTLNVDDNDLTAVVDGPGTLTSASASGHTSLVIGVVGGNTALNSITLSDAGTFLFASDVSAATISTTAAGALEFDGAVRGNVSLFTGSTAELGIDNILTGDVEGAGTLTLLGGNTVSGAVGATTALKNVNVSGVGLGDTTFGGAVSTADVNISDPN